MIISASRRTDIPALYAEWFMNRLRDRYLLVQNPFNAHKYTRVDLHPDKVDAIVFWTKNPRPLMKYIDELDNMGFKYYFQFTLTGYPKTIEQSLPDVNNIISTFKELSDKIGRNKVIWRYDPIIISDITDKQFIVHNFEKLAMNLNKFTRRVVISYADFYKKITKNFDKIKKEKNISFYDINANIDEIHDISSRISRIAKEYALDILSCAEKFDLSDVGIQHGKCIDDDLLRDLYGLNLRILKDKYQREECGCVQSRDIGQYNSCTHDCVYCYANNNKNLARKNQAEHDPSSPALIGNYFTSNTDSENNQLDLLK